jgi:hypothetical protein
LRESGFADAGHVFNQEMPAREQSDEGEPHGFRLAFDDALDGRLEPQYFSPVSIASVA